MHYLLLGIWLTGVALGQPQGSGQGVRWKLHDDPSGFTLQVPESWTLAVNRGSITMQGPDSVRASIWPTVIRNQKLDDAAAQILLQRVASQSEPEFRWSPIRQNGKFIAVSGRSGSSSATMSLTWASADYGTSAIIYFASASASRYDSMRPIFAKVFGSFDPKTEASGKSPSSVSALGQLQYVPWTDPLEQAFTIDVPKGWKIIGGQHSLTANDTRGAAVMIAEGGGAVVQFGQSEFGSFIEPVRTPYGSIQSGYYPLGDGTRSEEHTSELQSH